MGYHSVRLRRGSVLAFAVLLVAAGKLSAFRLSQRK